VVDSIAALVPRTELEGAMGQRHAGVQANLLSQALRKLCGPIARANTAVLVTNQLRQWAGAPGTPLYTSGGRALGYYASVRLDLRPLGPIRDGGQILGSRIRVLVVKNKVAPAWQTAELVTVAKILTLVRDGRASRLATKTATSARRVQPSASATGR
jgi:recombination protein RecA